MPSPRRHSFKYNLAEPFVPASARALSAVGCPLFAVTIDMVQYSSSITASSHAHYPRRKSRHHNPMCKPGSSRPSCTHMTVDRVHAPDLMCDQCHYPPQMGIMYVCRQDERQNYLELYSFPSSDDRIYGEDPLSTAQAVLRKDLERVGLSDSIIKCAEEGVYTPVQLEVLKNQRKHVIGILEQAEVKKKTQKRPSLKPDPENSGQTSQRVADSTTRRDRRKSETPCCRFAACPTCRTYFRDRMHMSFEAAFNGQYPPVTENEVQHLRTLDAAMLRCMNWDQPAGLEFQELEQVSSLTMTPLQSDNNNMRYEHPNTSEVDLDRVRSKSTADLNLARADATESLYSDSSSIMRQDRRHSIKNALRFLGLGRSPSRSSIVTEPLSASETIYATETRQDSAYQPYGAACEASDAHSSHPSSSTVVDPIWRQVCIVQPLDHAADGILDEPLSNPLRYHPILLHKTGREFDAACEVEVDGGVALTEEAVETKVPDVITLR